MPQTRLFPQSAAPYPLTAVVGRNTPASPATHPGPPDAVWPDRRQQTLFSFYAPSNDIRLNAIQANRLLREQSGSSCCCIPMETPQPERLSASLRLLARLHAQQSGKKKKPHNFITEQRWILQTQNPSMSPRSHGRNNTELRPINSTHPEPNRCLILARSGSRVFLF